MRIALLLVLVTPTLVAADAIMPLPPGACPVGSEVGIRDHAEACIPIDCTEADRCPDGSSCVALCTCRAERERYGRGGPYTAVEEIGRCNASGECEEGDVFRRSECQPSPDAPPTMEATMESTTMEATMEPAPGMQASATPTTEEESGGCSAAGTVPAFGFAALLLFMRRR